MTGGQATRGSAAEANQTPAEWRTGVAIVGAGPAGLAAARELRAAHQPVLLIDEGQRLGGQIFRQPPVGREDAVDPAFEPPSHRAGHELIHAVEGVDCLAGATVWDLTVNHDGVRVACEQNGRGCTVFADQLLLATGAMDRPLPFPGWTLPGVVTAGAAQVMVRGQLVRPGQRAVVAGTGPLLLPTVTALLRAGVEVVGLFEANRRGGLLRTIPAVLGKASKRAEAWHYVRRLLGAGVRMRTGHAVFAALGDGRVQRVVYGKLDRDGNPRAGTERELAADLLCTGYGLLPATELAVRLGCDMRHHDLRGGWVPRHDETMATSVAGVWVAGEIAGIGGADVAMAEGALAGRAIANHRTGEAVDLGALRAKVRKERGVTDALLRAFPVLPGLWQLAQRDTILCRCEDVTFGEVADAATRCGADVRSIKLATRAGMGPCQARICHRIIGGILQERLSSSELPTPCMSVRVPIKPVAVRTLIDSLR